MTAKAGKGLISKGLRVFTKQLRVLISKGLRVFTKQLRVFSKGLRVFTKQLRVFSKGLRVFTKQLYNNIDIVLEVSISMSKTMSNIDDTHYRSNTLSQSMHLA